MDSIPPPPIVEIFSNHGASEYYNNPYVIHNKLDAQAPEGSGSWVLEAIANEQIPMGFTGGSDSHYAMAGSETSEDFRNSKKWQKGLEAVLAPELTREAIFTAQRNRHTYATTGQRIILITSIGDAIMGDITRICEPPKFETWVIGTKGIHRVDLVRDGLVIQRWEGLSSEAYLSYVDDEITQGMHEYHVRVFQTI